MRQLTLLLTILIASSTFGQTNIQNALMEGRMQYAFNQLEKSIWNAPSEQKSLLSLQEMTDLFSMVSNTSGFTNACLSMMESSIADPFLKYKAREFLLDYLVLTGQIKKSINLTQVNGPITNWKALGPFRKTGPGDFNYEFSFEKEFDENRTYEESGISYSFYKIHPFTIAGEMAPFYGRNSKNSTCYLSTSIYAPADGTYFLHIQSSDPYKLWLNKKLIQTEKQVSTEYSPDNYIQMNLKKGLYKVILKMGRKSALPVFRISFVDSGWKAPYHSKDSAIQGSVITAESIEGPDLRYALSRTERPDATAEDWFFLARKNLYNGRIDQFTRNMNKALDMDKKNRFMRYYYSKTFILGDEYSGSSRINRALEFLKDESLSRYSGANYLLAYNDIINGRLREAAERIARLPSTQKNSTLMLIMASRAYSELNWENELVKTGKKALQKAPSHKDTVERLAQYYDKKNPAEAFALRSRYMSIRPNSLDNILLARAFIFAGKYEEALATIDKLEERFPSLVECTLLKAEIASRRGLIQEMKKLLAVVTENYSDNSYFMDTVSRLQYHSGMREEGLSNLVTAMTSDPGNIFLADRLSFLTEKTFEELQEYIDISKDPETVKTAFTSQDTSESGAVILNDEEVLKINHDGTWYMIIRQFIKITDKKGIERWASPSIPYYPRIKILRAVTRLENGEQIDATEMKRQNEFIVISYPAVRKDAVVELCYMISGGENELAEGTPWLTTDMHIFRTKDDPIKNVSYQIITAKDMPLSIRKGNFGKSVIETISTNGNMQCLSFTAKEMAPLKEETSLPSLPDLVPWISYSTFPKDESLFRAWFHGLTDPILTPYSEFDTKLFTFTDNRDLKNNPYHIARKIYLWINKNIRVLEGSPFTFQESRKTLDLLTGTVMDKILLMKAFLQRLGLSSDILLIRTTAMPESEKIPLDTKLFDDALLKVKIDGKTYFLDMHGKHLAFGDMTWEKHNAFAMNMTTGMTERLPSLPQDKQENIIIYSNNAFIPKDGIIQLTGTRTFKGYYTVYQDIFEDKDTFELTVNQIENQNLRGLSVTNSRLMELDGTNRSFQYSVKGFSASWISGTGEKRSIPFFGSKTRLFDRYITDMSRKSPLKIYMPIQNEQTILYKFDGWEVSEKPSDLEIKTEFGSYLTSYKKLEDGSLKIKVKTDIPLQTIPVEKYQSFVDFCKQVNDTENQEVLIKR